MALPPSKDEVQRRLRFSALINQLIIESGKSNGDIAEAMGYDKPNIISMLKSGKTRLPADRITDFSKAVGFDAGQLLREWFAAFEPDVLPAIEQHMGMMLSSSERSWVVALRRIFDRVPPYDRRLDDVLQSNLQTLSR